MSTKTSYWVAIAFLAVAFLGRFSGLPQNFWLFGAATLFAGCYLRGPLAFLLPIGMYGLSDFLGHAIGYQGIHLYFGWTMLINYLALAGYAGFGLILRKDDSLPMSIAAAFGGSVLFFIVSNFAAWLDPHLGYSNDLQGLANCYIAGIPFHRNTLTADLVFSFLMFGCHHSLLVWMRQPQPAPRSTRR